MHLDSLSTGAYWNSIEQAIQIFTNSTDEQLNNQQYIHDVLQRVSLTLSPEVGDYIVRQVNLRRGF